MIQMGNDAIRKGFPAFPFVGIGLAAANRQHGVEQQNSLFGPGSQIAVRNRGKTDIILQFLIDVFERGRNRNPPIDRKAQPLCLPGFVIRILPDDHDFGVGK